MNAVFRYFSLVALLLALVGCGSVSKSDLAIAEIEKLDGFVESDEGHVFRVDFSETEVSDDALVHLEELPHLQDVGLFRTKVTDSGLIHLKGLTNLQELDLSETEISDAGLLHLKGLTKLKILNLFETQVSDEGVNELKKALPNCTVER